MESSIKSKQKLDFSALTKPIEGSDVKAFTHVRKAVNTLIVPVRIMLYTFVIGALGGTLINQQFNAAIIILIVGVVVVEVLMWLIRLGRLRLIKPLQTGLRLARFAEVNGFSFKPTIRDMQHTYLGSAYQENKLDARTDFVVSGSYRGRDFWLGLFFYTVRVNKQTISYRQPVAVMTLPRAVPHVILDRGNKGVINYLSNLVPLQLEGDFNKHFRVLCPPGYERDVLYFLTPELMQLFVDMDQRFDVEIVGDQLYFYADRDESSRPVDPTVWQHFFVLMQSIGDELIENTRRYQDHRIDTAQGTLAATGLGKRPTPVSGKTVIIAVIITFVTTFVFALIFAYRDLS